MVDAAYVLWGQGALYYCPRCAHFLEADDEWLRFQLPSLYLPCLLISIVILGCDFFF